MRPLNIIAATLLLSCIGTLLPRAAVAHHRSGTGDTSGVPVANLNHGQLQVMARYRSAILALAGRQSRPDVETRRLMNFAKLQHAYCLWGLVPGTLNDEDSPFNECAHAYLGASKTLLDRLQQAPENRAEAHALAQKINGDMLIEGSGAFAMCRNGAAAFNTADVVMPEWRGVTVNPIVGLSGFAVLVSVGGTIALGRVRRRAKSLPV